MKRLIVAICMLAQAALGWDYVLTDGTDTGYISGGATNFLSQGGTNETTVAFTNEMTFNTNVTVSGDLTVSNSLHLPDNVKILFGTTTLGSIYSDGADMYIDSTDNVAADELHITDFDNIIVEDGYLGIGETDPEAPFHATYTTFPVGIYERTTTTTSDERSVFGMRLTTSGNMANGHGPGFIYQIEDDANYTYNIASIYALRDGGDGKGKLSFRPFNSSSVTAFEVKYYEANFPIDSYPVTLGAGNDFSLSFNGSDAYISSENITANDELNFTDFDAYNFDNDITLPDSMKLILGTGSDTEIYFDGTFQMYETAAIAHWFTDDIFITDSGSNPRIVIGDDASSDWSYIQYNSSADTLELSVNGGVNTLTIGDTAGDGIVAEAFDFTLDSSGNALITVDRGTTNNTSIFDLRVAGVNEWGFGTGVNGLDFSIYENTDVTKKRLLVEEGAAAGTQLQLASDFNVLIPNDSAELRFGAGSDFAIYGDGSDMYIDSRDITANDELNFTDFDAYLFDSDLGINVAAPLGQLHMKSPADGTATEIFFDRFDNAVNGDGNELWFTVANAGVGQWYMGMNDHSSYRNSFQIGDAQGITDAFIRFDTNGLVSIPRQLNIGKTVSGLTRNLWLQGSTTAGEGSYIEFGSSTTPGFGPWISGERHADGSGRGDLVFYTGRSVSTSNEERMRISVYGDISMPNDNQNLLFGAASDWGLSFDGSDAYIDSSDITANDELNFTDFDFYNFDAPVRADDFKSADSASGIDLDGNRWLVFTNFTSIDADDFTLYWTDGVMTSPRVDWNNRSLSGGDWSFSDDASLADSGEMKFGTGDDVRFFFDGTDENIDAVSAGADLNFTDFDWYNFDSHILGTANVYSYADSAGYYTGAGSDMRMFFDSNHGYLQSQNVTANDQLYFRYFDQYVFDNHIVNNGGQFYSSTDNASGNYYLGAGSDASIRFDGSDMYIVSRNITASDELFFQNFDHYTFDTDIKVGPASIATDSTCGLYFHTAGTTDYAIYREAGAWSAPDYQPLHIEFATGVIIDGGTVYGKSGVSLQPSGGEVTIGELMTLTPTSSASVTNTGTVYYDSDDNKVKVWTGSAWENLN